MDSEKPPEGQKNDAPKQEPKPVDKRDTWRTLAQAAAKALRAGDVAKGSAAAESLYAERSDGWTRRVRAALKEAADAKDGDARKALLEEAAAHLERTAQTI